MVPVVDPSGISWGFAKKHRDCYYMLLQEIVSFLTQKIGSRCPYEGAYNQEWIVYQPAMIQYKRRTWIFDDI